MTFKFIEEDTLLEHHFNEAKHSSDKWQPYFKVYEKHLEWKGVEPFTLVEVGVQKGGSLEMWADFFRDSVTVIGVDVDPECAKLTYPGYTNISVEIGDQGKPEFWDDFLIRHPKIDVFIDDGGHFCDAQILTFEKVFPTMPVGGIYICEDCHTSYMPYNKGGLHYKNSFIEYAKSYIDVIHQDWWNELDTTLEKRKVIGKDLTSIHFYDSMVVFEKFGKPEMKRVFPKAFI